MYYGDALVERMTILSENYPLVYKIASFCFEDDPHMTKCFVMWEDVVLANFTNNSQLNSVQQIPPSL